MTTVPMPLMIAPSWTVEYSSLAIGIGPVSRTRGVIILGEFQVGSGLADRVGGVLAGL